MALLMILTFLIGTTMNFAKIPKDNVIKYNIIIPNKIKRIS